MVIVILGILTAIAIPKYIDMQDEAQTSAEKGVVGGVRTGIMTYYADQCTAGSCAYPAALDSADDGDCSSDNPCFGTVLTQPIKESTWSKSGNEYTGPTGTTYTYDPDAGTFTSLDSMFEEITSGLIALVEEFYDENGRYPRSWGDYVFTDLGLDPEEWQQDYEGIIYTPAGSRIKIEPAEGYALVVNKVDGSEVTITDRSNWNIWYDMVSSKWYSISILPNNEVDISTLQVIER